MCLEMLRPLGHRDFRLLWIGQTVSNLGNGLYSVALPFQILQLGGTPLQLGTGFTVYTSAQLVTTLLGGAIVDRLPRRRVILASDLLSALVVGALAGLGLLRHLTIVEVYAASAFFGATTSFYYPAMSAITPELVPGDVLIAGNALRGMSSQASRVLGPLFGGFVVTALGPPAAFAIDAATFLFSFGMFTFSRPPGHEPPPRKPILSDIREGVAFTFSVPWLWISIVGFTLTNAFFFAGFSVALPLLVLHTLHGTATTFGVIGAVAGTGELVGGLVVGNLRVKRFGVGVYTFSALLGLGFLLYGAAPYLAVVLAGAFTFALMIVMSNTTWETALQKHVPRQLLGRVTSVDNFGSWLIAPVAPLLSAAAIGISGPSVIFVAGGLIDFAYWISMLLLVRSVRELE
jgi:predicted MFS family arabinose efflux permease